MAPMEPQPPKVDPAVVKQTVIDMTLELLDPVIGGLVAKVPSQNTAAYLGVVTALEIVRQRLLASAVEQHVPEGERSRAFNSFAAATSIDARQALVPLHPWLSQLVEDKQILTPGHRKIEIVRG